MHQLIKYTAGLILVCLIGFLLIEGRTLLIPLVVALFIWNLLNTLTDGIQRLPKIGQYLPYWLCTLLSLACVFVLFVILINIVNSNISEVTAASDRYQANLARIFTHFDPHYIVNVVASIEKYLRGLNMQNLVVGLYGVFSGLMSSAVLIILYVIFLFVEQHVFQYKINALFHHREHRQLVNTIFTEIAHDIQTYLGLKTLLGLLASGASWLIMRAVGLDFAEFWALLIFLFSFVPNIGPIVATIFPALLAVIQYSSWWQFFVVAGGIVAVQFIVGNVIEPRYVGNSLNLSPLVILITLSLWGMLWGVLGMFLAVPITVVMMIVLSHFSATRPIAILLSLDGRIKI